MILPLKTHCFSAIKCSKLTKGRREGGRDREKIFNYTLVSLDPASKDLGESGTLSIEPVGSGSDS